MDKKPLIQELRAMDDKWITIGGSENPHKVLLDDQGNIKGGSIPKELHGASIEEGFKALKNTGERKSSPRKEGESPEDYKKRSTKERRDRRKALAAELAEIMGKSETVKEDKNESSKKDKLTSELESIKAQIKEAKEHYREGGYHAASLQSLYNKRDKLVGKLKEMAKQEEKPQGELKSIHGESPEDHSLEAASLRHRFTGPELYERIKITFHDSYAPLFIRMGISENSPKSKIIEAYLSLKYDKPQGGSKPTSISKRPAPGVSPKAVKARKEAEARGKTKPTVESVKQ